MAAAHHALDIGLVVSGHGRHYLVETPEGRQFIAHPRGKKSDAVVGDQVRWQPTGEGSGEGVIEHIEPRTSLLYRQDNWRSKAFAANLDQVLVMVAVQPVFSESQLARALVACTDAGIEARIVLNKVDLPEAHEARARLLPYRAMGVEVLEVALKRQPQDSKAVLWPALNRRRTLVLGPSGVGKSTLINLFVPQAAARTAEISEALNSGKHTTTHTRWFWLDEAESGHDDGSDGGRDASRDLPIHHAGAQRSALIDSPGFQEFGLKHIEPARLPGLMPDIARHANGCRFYNCTHRHEPGCGVLAAIERGEIVPSRARIYGELINEGLGERPR